MSAGKPRTNGEYWADQIAAAEKRPTPAERINRIHNPQVAPEVIEGLKALAKKPLTLTLGLPPSMNAYWRNVNGRTLISRAGRTYAKDVEWCVFAERKSLRLACKVRMRVDVYFPDKRRRDLDNLQKPLADALTKAGVWLDDSQIAEWDVRHAGYRKPGQVEITITPIG